MSPEEAKREAIRLKCQHMNDRLRFERRSPAHLEMMHKFEETMRRVREMAGSAEDPLPD
jgi:hypothetical protein